MKKCSLLNIHKFSLLKDQNNIDLWFCPSCSAKNLPFNELNESNFLLFQNDVLDKASDELKLYSDESFTQFINTCENLSPQGWQNTNSGSIDYIQTYLVQHFSKIF